MPIHILSEKLIAQIAAGEVVERPTSVVKELLENALDAGAKTIHISTQEGGRKLIRVSDDGMGICADEVELAFARHATSKLSKLEDLEQLQTLGFRGEALASIASVSRLMMTTRHYNENIGTQIRIEGGTITQKIAVGVPNGTVVTVENLFYNTPARLKFLKSENTEKRHIVAVVTNYAIAYPQVKFILEQDGREIFRSIGNGQLADVVVRAVGLETFKHMLEVYVEDPAQDDRPPVRVWGYTSAPDLSRADRGNITLFVNGRWIQDAKLTYAVVQAYHTLLMTGRYPIAVLMIEIPPHEVDVNVHPTKAEVRFRDPNAVFSTIQRAVRMAVIGKANVPDIRLRGGNVSIPSTSTDATWNLGNPRPRTTELPLNITDTGQYPQQYPQKYASDETFDLSDIPEGLGLPKNPRTLPMLRVVGQVGAMYIVAEGPAGMYLIDQHAAHERILYEQYIARFSSQEIAVQQALSGQTITFSPSEASLVMDKLDALKAVGFELEPFGNHTFVIRAVPAILADKDPVTVIAGVIDDLQADKQPGMGKIEEKLIRFVCRHVAVKAGQILNHQQMQDLIRQLEFTRNPHTCPHGRPTLLHLSGDQLAREFGRGG
jgi:DNA mismatch repair protein MutL